MLCTCDTVWYFCILNEGSRYIELDYENSIGSLLTVMQLNWPIKTELY